MIYGIQKLSLVDYPKEISLVIFTGGCNFNCGFCHNKSIVEMKEKQLSEEYVLSLLKERINFIHCVVITGGEPTIYKERLISLIIKIKEMGFKVKLDTNGTSPEYVSLLLEKNLLDYIAMDIKNTFIKYNETISSSTDINTIKKSIKLIENSKIPYEFRTTINKTNHTIEDIKEIITYVKDPTKLYIQGYEYSEYQINKQDYKSFTKEELKEIEQITKLKVKM